MIIKIILGLFVGGVLLLAARIGRAYLRYQQGMSKLKAMNPKKEIPAYPYWMPYLLWFSRYEEWFENHFDKSGNPVPVMSEGPDFEGNPILMLTNPDVNKELLGHSENFIKTPTSYEPITHFFGRGLVFLEGAEWKKERRLLTPLFHYGSLKAMVPIMNQVGQEMVRNIAEKSSLTNIPADFIKRWALQVNIRAIFGDSFDVNSLQTLFEMYFKIIEPWFMALMLLGDWLFRLPFIPAENTRRRVKSQLVDLILHNIENRRKNGSKETSDLISLMMGSSEPFPDSSIVSEALTFLFAGYDTTSVLLRWTLYFLAKYPDVQSKMLEEINMTWGTSTDITEEQVSHLRYVRAVLSETLRMRPPVVALDRMCVKDTELDGIKIPQGTIASCFIHVMHVDPKQWSNPREFIPERFLQNKERHPFAYVPFSAGERNCIGQKVAMQEATILIAYLVRAFEIRSKTLDKVVMGMEVLSCPQNLFLDFIPRK